MQAKRKIKQIPTKYNYINILATQNKRLIRQIAINRLIMAGMILFWIVSELYRHISYQLWLNSTIGA